MRRFLTITFCLLLFLIVACLVMGQSRWHIERNALNELPSGKLTLVKDTLYKDANDREWVRLPASMNAFHQPGYAIEAPTPLYGDTISPITFAYDAENPNLKFLSKTPDGGSFEAILQPDGTYLETGPQLGTYNYGHPEGIRGMLSHTLWDVLPHFANGNYK